MWRRVDVSKPQNVRIDVLAVSVDADVVVEVVDLVVLVVSTVLVFGQELLVQLPQAPVVVLVLALAVEVAEQQ